ncbi:hypothetical protein ASE09_04135 [Streptomyces sp. Root66D1]|nr:hypothetical protein ASD33_04130 [Streptomyces sp. Root1304]KRB00729.1 hypothetical protein ASE09_04135 [Streptomyces sp. Root66D1]
MLRVGGEGLCGAWAAYGEGVRVRGCNPYGRPRRGALRVGEGGVRGAPGWVFRGVGEVGRRVVGGRA